MIYLLWGVLFWTVVALYLTRADLKDARKQMENFNPYYHRMCAVLGEAETRMRRLREERNMWRDRWKRGAFEMDAATMAKLADEQCGRAWAEWESMAKLAGED